MYSPRSVSTTSTPASCSALFRSTSSAAIDFDLTARVTPSSRAMPAAILLACAASEAT